MHIICGQKCVRERLPHSSLGILRSIQESGWAHFACKNMFGEFPKFCHLIWGSKALEVQQVDTLYTFRWFIKSFPCKCRRFFAHNLGTFLQSHWRRFVFVLGFDFAMLSYTWQQVPIIPLQHTWLGREAGKKKRERLPNCIGNRSLFSPCTASKPQTMFKKLWQPFMQTILAASQTVSHHKSHLNQWVCTEQVWLGLLLPFQTYGAG